MENPTKSVLVTGASTGIGRATAEYLAENGFHVYACARKDEDIGDLNKINNITAIKMDVTNKDQIKTAFETISKSGTGLYGIVNNAGIGLAGPLMDLDEDVLIKQFDVNLIGVHRVTRMFFPLILKSHGRIIMMSSDSGFFASPFFGPYCSSKFALEGYSDSLRRELLIHDVKVVIIEPGRITTPIWNKGKYLLDSFEGSMFAKEARFIGEYSIRKGNTAGLPPIEVAKVVYLALTKKKPKLRYIVAENKMKYYMIKLFQTLPPGRKVDKTVEKEFLEILSNDS